MLPALLAIAAPSIISAAGAIAGGVMSAHSSSKTNATNKKIAQDTNEMNYLAQQEANKTNMDIANATNAANMQMTNDTNATNKAIAEQNLAYQRELQEYQKNLQQQLFAREDNASQRKVADLVAAGLSPTLAAGAGAGAGTPVSIDSLHNDYVAQAGHAEGARVGASHAQIGAAMSPINFGFLTDAMNGFLQAAKTREEINYMKSQVAGIDASTVGKKIENEINLAIKDARIKAAELGNQLKQDEIFSIVESTVQKKLENHQLELQNKRSDEYGGLPESTFKNPMLQMADGISHEIKEVTRATKEASKSVGQKIKGKFQSWRKKK